MKMPKSSKFMIVTVLISSMAMLYGCGTDDLDYAAPAGAIVKGKVAGATIFADSNANEIQDTNGNTGKTETATVSDAAGNFKLTLDPFYGPYTLVSFGGTDTISGQPAGKMMAPAGSKNITPITSMMVSTPPAQRAALLTTLKSLGMDNADDDIEAGASPAILAIATALNSVNASIKNTVGTTSYSASEKIQADIIAEVAKAVKNLTAGTITPAAIATIMADATEKALNNSADVTTTPAEVAAIKASVNTSVTNVTTAIQTASGTTFSDTAKKAENTVITPAVKTSLQTESTNVQNTVSTNSTTTANTTTKPPVVVTTGTGGTP